MIHYNGCRMDKPESIARMERIRALTAELGTATVQQFADRLGLTPRMAHTYVSYLCSIERLTIRQKHNAGLHLAAVYGMGSCNDPLPLSEQDADTVIQRWVGANDWPRGEHVPRNRLVAQESTAGEG